MKPPPFGYFRPENMSDAVQILSTHENSKVLAGGQSLMAMLNLRYILPDVLVDINRIPGLDGIEVGDRAIRIGAIARQRTIERDARLAEAAPIFAAALAHVGHRQTRNRGTIGGSLCHLDPAAELPALALLHDATVDVVGTGTREIPIRDFIAGFMMPGIEPEEIVSAVSLTPWARGHGYGFAEHSRRHGDFAIALAACLVEKDFAGTLSRAAIVIGGVGSVAQRLEAGERALVGSRGETDAIEAAVDSCATLEAIGDFHGSPEYRLAVARAMLRKSLGMALANADKVT